MDARDRNFLSRADAVTENDYKRIAELDDELNRLDSELEPLMSFSEAIVYIDKGFP